MLSNSSTDKEIELLFKKITQNLSRLSQIEKQFKVDPKEQQENKKFKSRMKMPMAIPEDLLNEMKNSSKALMEITKDHTKPFHVGMFSVDALNPTHKESTIAILKSGVTLSNAVLKYLESKETHKDEKIAFVFSKALETISEDSTVYCITSWGVHIYNMIIDSRFSNK